MDPSSALHHHQELSSQTLESMLVSTKPQQEIKKPKPPAEQSLNCPRCDSTNTKFCYYNNYSLSQPRYFCKSCRRYWTKGGTLRNVPVGGGCRKKQKSSSSKITSQEITSQNNPIISSFTQQMSYDSSDLSLAFARLQKQTNGHFGIENHNNISMMSSAPPSDQVLGFLENPSNVGFYQNLYYGNIGNNSNNGDMGHVENGGNYMGNMNYDQEISSNMTTTTTATTTATTMTTVKQEVCNMARDQSENDQNKVLWGFPWQINGDNGNYNMGEFDSSRRIWNGVGGSSWHGLLNSPLM